MKQHFKIIVFFLCFSVYGQDSKLLEYSIVMPKNQGLLDLIDKAYSDSSLHPKEKSNKKIVTLSMYDVLGVVRVDLGIYEQLFTGLDVCNYYQANY